jgi:hypothetical protein
MIKRERERERERKKRMTNVPRPPNRAAALSDEIPKEREIQKERTYL